MKKFHCSHCSFGASPKSNWCITFLGQGSFFFSLKAWGWFNLEFPPNWSTDPTESLAESKYIHCEWWMNKRVLSNWHGGWSQETWQTWLLKRQHVNQWYKMQVREWQSSGFAHTRVHLHSSVTAHNACQCMCFPETKTLQEHRLCFLRIIS